MEERSPKNRLVAVCGKGGTGKTAFISIMTKILMQHDNQRILVIDADPAMSLANALGVEIVKTIGEIREEIIKSAARFRDDEEEKLRIVNTLDYMVLEALAEKSKFGLLVMGRPEAVGCFCPVNDLLRDAIETLSKNFDVTLIDGEAGIEQIHRQVVRVVDSPVILTDTSSRGLQTAALIKKIVESKKLIRCKRLAMVVNRVRGEEETVRGFAEKVGVEILGYIPEDENISRYDLRGQPLTELPDDSPSVVAIRQVSQKLGLLDGGDGR